MRDYILHSALPNGNLTVNAGCLQPEIARAQSKKTGNNTYWAKTGQYGVVGLALKESLP